MSGGTPLGGTAGRPERLDHFMARAAAAYYAGRDPFGARGDFITAPEISQAFGECLGLWAAVVWQEMGRPDPVLLVELGPGRGTLMADALRAVAGVLPAFRAALRLHLVEQSPALREAQRRALGQADPMWHDELSSLPAGPALVLGNEFLDALPIRQFIRRGDGWRERFVQAGAFVEQDVGPGVPLPPDAPEGAVQEVSEACRAVAAMLGARLAAQGGAALFLDYGPARSGLGDSLQALSVHRAADPLAAPGTADITAHVDFQAVAEAARAAGAAVQGPLPQGMFLQSIGLVTRAAALAGAAPAHAGRQLSAAQRLIAPEGMGRLFKALALCHPALSSLPGFQPS
ncbi:SAM-dependent methyltransferase [Roseomonas vastitatis]|uniref:SAM-dependent methyltransferase n=2 Tax=Teichococcus vastitatis TaxID=2307076 RepID=A0ABS9W4G2_9PROT|nr:SAM-dependent methyltransferase [Pseudoroseomonas vastitatis]MCI0754167.1 SAM-dependent methyltransferase [Pseudoroseomonas vastitatis]